MRNKAKADDMPTDDKPALVPKLRFPEFRVAPSWKRMRLGHNLKFQPGFPFASSGFNDAGRGPRLIRNRDLRSDDIIVFYSDTFDESFVVNDGDVLVGMDGDFTPTIWTKGKALLNQRVGRVYPRADNDRRFLYYLLTLCLKKIEEETARTTVKHLSHSALEERYEPLASPAEQLKIAECLSSLDEAVTAQARKVDALKKHKKGLMQQLFPSEGETQPLRRFPEFQNAGEWAKTTLRMICQRIMDGTHFSPRTKEGPRPYLTSKNIRMGWLDLSTITFIAEDEHRSIYARCPVKKNDVLLTKDGANTGNCAINTIDEEFSLLSSVAVLRGDPEQIIQQFLYQSIASDGMQSRIVNSMSGQAITRITLEKLGNYEILIPNISEQQYIADLLSSLDTLFIAETQKLEALKTHKRGLMQQLFPSPKEAEK